MPIWSAFKWGINHNVALASLTYVEDDLLTAFDGQYVHPTNDPIRRFPLVEMALDGVPRSQGVIAHTWRFVLPLAAIQYIISTFFIVSAVHVAYRDVTVNLLDHELGIYTRWNARVFRPIPGEDYTYDVVDQLSTDFRLRMLLLEYLPEP